MILMNLGGLTPISENLQTIIFSDSLSWQCFQSFRSDTI